MVVEPGFFFLPTLPVLDSGWIFGSHARIICQHGLILIRASEGQDVWGNGALTGERNLNDREGEESFARRAPQEE